MLRSDGPEFTSFLHKWKMYRILKNDSFLTVWEWVVDEISIELKVEKAEDDVDADDDEEGGAELLLDGYSVLERDISIEKNEAPKIKSENLVTAGDGRDLVSRSACWCSVGMNLKRMFIDLTQPRT